MGIIMYPNATNYVIVAELDPKMEIVMANQGTAIALQDMLVQNAQENASLVFMGQNAMKVNVILKYIITIPNPNSCSQVYHKI